MKSSASKEMKPSEKSKTSVLASRSSSSAPILKTLNKQLSCSERSHQSRDSESQKASNNKECSSSGSKHASQSTNPEAEERTFIDSKKSSERQHSSVADKGLLPLKEESSKDASKQRNTKHVKKPKQKLLIKTKAKLSSDEEFEPPTMSFESYLNYDQVTEKRKRKACSRGERPKKCTEQNNRSLPQKTSTFSYAKEGEKDVKKCEGEQLETPYKKVNHCMVEVIANKLQTNNSYFQ